MKHIRYIILFLTLILWFSDAYGYETCKTSNGNDIYWNTSDAEYYINSSGGPSATISAVEAGMQSWTDVATSGFIFIYKGTTGSTAHGIDDGINIVTFGLLDAGTAAENRFWYNSQTGRLYDSDIQFNTYYPWNTNGSSGALDVQNVGTHEHGHSLCLKDLYDSNDSEKSMYGNVAYGETKKITLHQDDINGITYLYTCPNFPARIEGTTYEYDFFQDAYDNAASMATIQIQATVFDENLLIDMSKSVYLKAGYDCSYSNNILISTINGNMTITDGTLTIQSGMVVVQ